MKTHTLVFFSFLILISFLSRVSQASHRELLKCEAHDVTTRNRFSGTLTVEVDDFNQVSAVLNLNAVTAGNISKTAIRAEIEGEFEIIPEGILTKSDVNIYTLSNPLDESPRLALSIVQGPELKILSYLMRDRVRFVSYCHL